MMPRNLDRRVEAMLRVTDRRLRDPPRRDPRPQLRRRHPGVESRARRHVVEGAGRERNRRAGRVAGARDRAHEGAQRRQLIVAKTSRPRGPVRAAGGLVTRGRRRRARHRGARGTPAALRRLEPAQGQGEPGEPTKTRRRREVEEETGYLCALGDELTTVRYIDRRGRDKQVRYWNMTVIGEVAWAPNDEVDERRWISPAVAATLLTYEADRQPAAEVSPALPSEDTRDHLFDPPRQGGRPRHVVRRRSAATAARSRPPPGPPAHRHAPRRDLRPRPVEPVRALHGDRRSDRGRARPPGRAGRSARRRRARSTRRSRSFASTRPRRGPVHARRRDADAARPLRVGRHRHPERTAVAQGLHVGARHRRHGRGRARGLPRSAPA